MIADLAIYLRSQLTHNEPILLVIDSIAATDCTDNIDAKIHNTAFRNNNKKAYKRCIFVKLENIILDYAFKSISGYTDISIEVCYTVFEINSVFFTEFVFECQLCGMSLCRIIHF